MALIFRVSTVNLLKRRNKNHQEFGFILGGPRSDFLDRAKTLSGSRKRGFSMGVDYTKTKMDALRWMVQKSLVDWRKVSSSNNSFTALTREAYVERDQTRIAASSWGRPGAFVPAQSRCQTIRFAKRISGCGTPSVPGTFFGRVILAKVVVHVLPPHTRGVMMTIDSTKLKTKTGRMLSAMCNFFATSTFGSERI